MAKGRKARRNTLARVAETGQRPATAYRELRAANAPYEGYVVDLFHVPGAFEDGGHRGDSWGYQVCDPGGRPLVRWLFAPAEGDAPRAVNLFGGCGGWCVGIRRILGATVDMLWGTEGYAPRVPVSAGPYAVASWTR
ncbi:hypothetical protein ACIBBE_46985 [Streptomyces sp. NPDC051644]|uniref:hypothetical protein n=1 Tax=Streptomyces sp. NPDC051644 TaxID=3365666 RepID=UPI00379E2027